MSGSQLRNKHSCYPFTNTLHQWPHG